MKSLITLAIVLFTASLVWAAEPAGPAQDLDQPGMHRQHGPGHDMDRPDFKGPRNHRRPGPDVSERMEQRHDEFIKWLKENQPEEAAALENLKEKDPNAYFENLGKDLKKYGKIARADKHNPELGKVLREDMKVKEQIRNVAEKLRTATDDNAKKELSAQLGPLVEKQFDLLVAQRQLRLEKLNADLEELKQKVAKHQTELDELKTNKNAEVKKRLEELSNPKEKLNWD